MLHRAVEEVLDQEHCWQNLSWKGIMFFPEKEVMVSSEETGKHFSHE